MTKVELAKTIKWSGFNNTTDAKGQRLIVSITLKNIGSPYCESPHNSDREVL